MTEVYKKAIVLGDSCCGKSALLERFVLKKFQVNYYPTTFHNAMSPWIDVKTQGKDLRCSRVELALWDTPGGDDLYHLRQLSYPNKDLAFVCFSIVDRDSFLNVKKRWIPELHHHSPESSVILVGLKKDLRKNKSIILRLMETDGCQPVSTEEGEALAREVGANAYIECSARSGKNVQKVFRTAAQISVTTRL